MFRTKLIRLLKHLDKKEMIQLGHFLESPFFFKGRREQKLIDFFCFLKEFHPHFKAPELAKEKVYAVFFAGKGFNEQQLQQLMTKLNKAIEQFVEITYREEFFAAPPPGFGLSTFYRKKNLSPYFHKLHQKTKNSHTNQAQKDSHYYWIDYLLAKELAEHQSLFNVRKSDLNLPDTLSRLDYFFVVAKLESACVFLNQQKHQVPVDSKGALESLQALLPLLKSGRYREEPLIDLLYRTYCLLAFESTPAEFRELKKRFDQHVMKIGLPQRQNIHGVLRNFCSQKLNKGEGIYLKLLFELYQEGLSQGVVTFSGRLLPATFQTIVMLGLRLKKMEWVENFLEEYRDQLVRTEDSQAIYRLNRASLFFAKGAYSEALNCLTYEFVDIYLRLVARRMEVQIYYEQQSDLLDAKIKAFKIFVYRISKSRITDVQREGYSSFIDLLKQISHRSTRFNKKRIQSLIEKIASKKIVAEKKWLQQKLEEMK